MAEQPENDYASGRRNTLHKTRQLLIDDVDRFARVVVGDFTGPGVKKQALNPFVQIAKGVTRANLNALRVVIEDLESGATVYAITGTDSIPTYKPITGGDYNAGVMSAIDDMTVLLGTINGDEIFKPFVTSKNSLNDLAEENEIAMPQMFSYNHALLVDSIYMRIHEQITSKTPEPRLIAYEGTEAQIGTKSLGQRFKQAVLNQQYPLDRFARRASKMPTLWPPLHSRENMALNNHEQLAELIEVARDESLGRSNDNIDFREGFIEGLKVLYDDLQDFHFDQFGKAGGYAGNLGHDFSWTKRVNAVAMNSFGPLRDSLREKLQAKEAFGEGTSRKEGLQAALSLVLQEIAGLAPAHKETQTVHDVAHANALETILPLWVQEARKIMEKYAGEVSRPVTPSQPRHQPS
ncbi:MAG: hypothetical protein ACK4NR_11815 [Micavibrio sp.]